jgi:hypothetical protein
MHANFSKMLIASALIGSASSAFANVITDWNENAVTFVTPRMAPAAGQRVVAIVQVAMFDAVNSIERRYRPYLVQLPAAPHTSREAAAAAAAGTVLAALIPQVQGQVKGMTVSYIASIADGDAKVQGIKLGEAVAARIRAPATARTRPTRTVTRPSPASMCRRPSPPPRHGGM